MELMQYGVLKVMGKPDVLHSGTYKGYQFYIVNLGYNPAAYVTLNKTHPWYGTDYNIDYLDTQIEVHGGFTYSRYNHAFTDKQEFCLGWDYGHVGDYKHNSYTDRGHRWTTQDIFEEVKECIDQLIVIAEKEVNNEDN